MEFKIEGLDNLLKDLDALAQRTQDLDGEHQVAIYDLLTPDFLSACSSFSDVDQFFEASGIKVESQEDLEAIPDDVWDRFVNDNTSYANWQEMLEAAASNWIQRELGL